tara:strand:- start:883 stop:1287 length:405 start_codon:yes stop_codon:yes gene_type:complete
MYLIAKVEKNLQYFPHAFRNEPKLSPALRPVRRTRARVIFPKTHHKLDMNQGPCLAHCYCSPRTLLFARIAIGYTVACLLYLLFTRNIGTPFADSLTEEQQAIKQSSSMARATVFLTSVITSMILVHVWRPLRT